MSEAYVLINCALGHEEDIIEELNTVPGISEVHGTFGAYDILTKVSGDNSTDTRDIITEKIQKIKHVRSTLTLMVIPEQDQ